MENVSYRNLLVGYRIGDNGTVWTRWTKAMLPTGRGSKAVLGSIWRLMKLGRQTDRNNPNRSYLTVRLSENGKSRIFRVHRLVLEAFVGPCPNGLEARHLDGNPANNNRNNLCWGTPAENTEDKRKHGRHTSKARFYIHDGETRLLKDWARLFGIPYLTLWNRLNTGMTFADAVSIKRYDRKAIKRSKES